MVSSIILALISSGFNGQQFTFHGYLPIDKGEKENKSFIWNHWFRKQVILRFSWKLRIVTTSYWRNLPKH